MARTLTVEIIGDVSSLQRSFADANKSGTSLGKGLKVAAGVATAALGGIALAAKVGFDELAEAQKVSAQTGAALKSTAGAANITAKEIEGLAGSLSRMSGVDDEAIQSGENLLLTFTKVRNEAGKGNDVFDQATKTMLDMSVALGQDMKSSAIQLGKALNDPIKGVTALQRVGVSFTEAQKKQIKALVESGKTMEAQKLILGELTTEFGGSAKAAGETLPGQLAKAKNSFAEMSANLTAALLPAMTALAEIVSKASAFFNEHQTIAKVLIGTIAALSTVVLAAAAILKIQAFWTTVVAAKTAAWTAVQWLLNAALTANPIGVVVVALAALGAALVLAWKHSETFRAIVIGAFGAVRAVVQNVADFVTVKIPAAFGGALSWVRQHWPEIATLISGPFAPLVALATDAFGIRSALVGAFRSINEFVGGVLDELQAAFRWFGTVGVRTWKRVAEALSAPLDAITSLFQAWLDVLVAILNTIKAIIDKAGDVVGALRKIPGAGFIGKIPGFQHGVQNFKGGLALVGERGPELVRLPRGADVLPLTPGARPSLAAASGNGAAPSVTVYVAGSVLSEHELVDVIQRQVAAWQRRNGGSFFG